MASPTLYLTLFFFAFPCRAEVLFDCSEGRATCEHSWTLIKKNYCFLVADVRCAGRGPPADEPRSWWSTAPPSTEAKELAEAEARQPAGAEVSAQVKAPVEVHGKVRQRLSREPWAVTQDRSCSHRFVAPRPKGATDLNGAVLTPVCFEEAPGPHHVFVIGDWGGISPSEDMVPRPADRRTPNFGQHHRGFVLGADNCAQLSVAEQMGKRARENPPDYVLNVGDNFYWGGINTKCGAPLSQHCEDPTGQWDRVFERIYHGPGLAGKQWLGVLGNHDFGGYAFFHGWDQAIAYTWAEGGPSTGRWMTPALYWGQQVRYPGFSVDYYFVDSNVHDAFDPAADSDINICSARRNPPDASCGPMGPANYKDEDCPRWFERLWDAQMIWLHKGLASSTADWQIVVTHFPPEWSSGNWSRLSYEHGIDLIVTGHRHQQEVHHMVGNFLSPTAYIVSGGGGGITSESSPTQSGDDDQYGFMDLTLTQEEIMVEAISHGGALRSRTCIARRPPRSGVALSVISSLCNGREPGPLPAPPRPGGDLFYGPNTDYFYEDRHKG